LKRTETNVKSLTSRPKEELSEIIKAEKEAYRAQEKEDRSKVLDDVTKEQKLKKAETVDKTVLPDKKELTSQIKAEKEAQVIDDAHSKVLEDVSKGEKKNLKRQKQLISQRRRRRTLLPKFKQSKRLKLVIKLLLILRRAIII